LGNSSQFSITNFEVPSQVITQSCSEIGPSRPETLNEINDAEIHQCQIDIAQLNDFVEETAMELSLVPNSPISDLTPNSLLPTISSLIMSTVNSQASFS
jgi:hypothetical protein